MKRSDPGLLASSIGSRRLTGAFRLDRAIGHEGTTVEAAQPLSIATPAAPWSYAVSIPAEWPRDVGWPHELDQRDVLYFLAQSFRARLIKELPEAKAAISGDKKELAHRAKALIKELATISFEMAQLVVASEKGDQLPAWFMVEIVRDLPRLVEKKDEKEK